MMKSRLIIFSIFIALLTTLAYERNLVWTDDMEFWKDIVSKSPRKARGHNMLGIQYKKNRLFDEAMEQYFISLDVSPNAEAHNNIGEIYAAEGNNVEAIEHFLAALSINPNLVAAHFNLGSIYLGLGWEEKAQAELETTLQINPYHVEARAFLVYLSNNNSSLLIKKSSRLHK